MAKARQLAVSSRTGREDETRARFGLMMNGLKQKFRRGVEVAYKVNPTARIGEIHTPPAIGNSFATVTLVSGRNKTIDVHDLVVHEKPAET